MFQNTNMRFKDFIGSKFYFSVARSYKPKYISKLFLNEQIRSVSEKVCMIYTEIFYVHFSALILFLIIYEILKNIINILI